MLCPSAPHGHVTASVTEGEAETPEVVPLEEEKAQGGLPTVYKYLIGEGRGKEERAILISVEPSKRRKGSGHKLKYSKSHLSTRKSFFTV